MRRTITSLSQVLVAALALFAAGRVFAQGANTGALTGRVTDAASGQAVAGVTVVAQGPQGEQAEITDDTGTYTITGLVPGQYVVRYYFANVKVERTNVTVYADKKIQINVPIQTKATAAETYTITEKAPTVDIGSTKIGTTITKEFTTNVPTGRNFETVSTVAPGAVKDDNGISFAGATSFENNYVIDGINVTSVHMSQASPAATGSALNLDFVQEVEVITGGYNAEYGRATGGVVNVITKSGSNEFHGDAAFYYDPGSMRGLSPRLTYPGQSISQRLENAGGDYRMDFFADLGGPVIKDRLWFYVGFEPIFSKDTIRRTVSTLTDNCTQSDPIQAGPCTGGPDGYQDFTNGVYRSQEIYHTFREASTTQYQWTGKVNLLVTPDHTLEVAYYGSPNSQDNPRIFGTNFTSRTLGGAQDAVAHWVSKLFDKKWQLEASLSYHRERLLHEAADPLDSQLRTTWNTDPVKATNVNSRRGAGPSMSWFGQYEDPADRQLLMMNCDSVTPPDGTTTPQTPGMVTNNSPGKLNILCPAYSVATGGYAVGGRGTWENLISDRIGTRVAGTNFVRAGGHHQFMYGWDFERNGFDDVRLYSAAVGALTVRQVGANKRVYTRGWGYFKDLGTGLAGGITNIVNYPFKRDSKYNPVLDGAGNPVKDLSQCFRPEDIPSDASVFCAQTATLNHALFVRDSWNILPNLTLNLGVRWERQAVSGLADWEAPVNGDAPIVLNNNWAPRVGVIYDPTNEGKAKLYGSFARFYESIPLDINNRSFGQEGFLQHTYFYRNGTATTPNPAPNNTCVEKLIGSNTLNCVFRAPGLFGGEQSLIEPDIQGMFTDEIVLGGEYEIIEDLALGAYYTHRNLGPVIEDGSVDNASSYFITNPGEKPSSDQIKQLQQRADKANQLAMQNMAAGNMTLASNYNHLYGELQTFADELPYFGNFAKPERNYNAMTLTARKRFSKNWLGQASYTYARTIGNYPGLYDPYIGQKDPNITELYDLPDVLVNRNGPLPSDIPHQFKVDGYYTFRLRGDQSVVAGTSFRAQSGIPRNVFGVNQIYVPSPIVFLEPSSNAGRNDITTSWDLQLAYIKQLPRNTSLQVFFAVYNVLNSQTVTLRDDVYTTTSTFTTPIVNGTDADLKHLKTVDGAVATKNGNYGNPVAYQNPIFTRFGLRFSF